MVHRARRLTLLERYEDSLGAMATAQLMREIARVGRKMSPRDRAVVEEVAIRLSLSRPTSHCETCNGDL